MDTSLGCTSTAGCRYEQFDLSFTGFLINGDAGPLTEQAVAIYDSFSPDGVVVTTGHDPHFSPGAPAGNMYEKENGGAWCDKGGTPVIHHVIDLPGTVSDAAGSITKIIAADKQKLDMRGQPSFYFLRNILKPASYMVDVANAAMAEEESLVFVDPYTMGLLVKCHSGAIDCRQPAAGELNAE